ncbi:hypothetical protein U5640_22840 [Streptomyces sp. SS7]|uniref:hypothetical protein n=1 Tax=Streptomyces sp. SS7 TaxID=3108485 RepID=UPI0030ECF6A2
MTDAPVDAEHASYLEELAVYGRAVEHGVVPHAYAVDVLTRSPFHARRARCSPHDGADRVRHDLSRWEDLIVEWGLPLERVDQESWERASDAWLEEHLRRACRERAVPAEGESGVGGLLRAYVLHLMQEDRPEPTP